MKRFIYIYIYSRLSASTVCVRWEVTGKFAGQELRGSWRAVWCDKLCGAVPNACQTNQQNYAATKFRGNVLLDSILRQVAKQPHKGTPIIKTHLHNWKFTHDLSWKLTKSSSQNRHGHTRVWMSSRALAQRIEVRCPFVGVWGTIRLSVILS